MVSFTSCCGTCKFFNQGPDPERNDTYGTCVRYPIATGKQKTQWCGEFKYRVEIGKDEVIGHGSTKN